jgi:hypothetical protein
MRMIVTKIIPAPRAYVQLGMIFISVNFSGVLYLEESHENDCYEDDSCSQS